MSLEEPAHTWEVTLDDEERETVKVKADFCYTFNGCLIFECEEDRNRVYKAAFSATAWFAVRKVDT